MVTQDVTVAATGGAAPSRVVYRHTQPEWIDWFSLVLQGLESGLLGGFVGKECNTKKFLNYNNYIILIANKIPLA